MTRAALFLCLAFSLTASEVRLERVPNRGIQPQAVVDPQGTLHLLYFSGDPAGGDLFYVKRPPGAGDFSTPVRVNSQPGSAIAAGTIRGGQLALGRNGLVHVAWNGSSKAQPKGPKNPEMAADSPYNGTPMLYARSSGSGFEPQRNLMQSTFALDGGGTVTADGQGNVMVAWHAASKGQAKGEAGRAVWAARSSDDGATFASEARISPDPGEGACACCGMRMFAAISGAVYGLYRSAEQTVHRDIHLLSAQSPTGPFRDTLLDPWNIGACPMSSISFAEGSGEVVAAWETAGQIHWSAIPPRGKPNAAPDSGLNRKHPTIARSAGGRLLLAWSEGTGWKKGGSIAWQVYGAAGKPDGTPGSAPDLPAWSFPSAVALPDGGFLILY